MINLFIALFWLVLGVGLIVIPGVDHWRIRGTDLSIGWLAVGLAAYNLLRWYLLRRQSRPRYVSDDDQPPPAPREYNPEFDFTKEPPAPK